MDVVVVGAGVGGLTTAALLAGDGHDVTVVERDPSPPPASAEEAWAEWDRKGVNQFRMLHYFAPRFREVLEAELPGMAAALDDAGAARHGILDTIPDDFTGGTQPGDERFVALTGRRPVVEHGLAAGAAQAGITVQRGRGIAGLLVDDAGGDVPHVVGVGFDDGTELRADLVVDASGRRSALPRWLEALGARPPVEELEDCGFVYYGRHFRSGDGSTPPPFGPLLQGYGSISILTLPADHGTWGVGVITSAQDAELRGVADVDRWSAVVRACPLVAHWIDAEPIDERIAVMAKIEDRHRTFVVDGAPIATGVLAVADAWACTNPSVGRGASIGLLHAVALRDLLRKDADADPATLARDWHAATDEVVEPWYRATLSFDRHRLNEMHAALDGTTYETDDPAWELTQAMAAGTMKDPAVLRAFVKVAGVLDLPDDVLAEPGLFERVVAAGAGWRDQQPPGPTRAELVTLAAR
jgi:2-polyprenyl-6-methoxyphenol hydroxylase-like FAD-dependent oxidoreductase